MPIDEAEVLIGIKRAGAKKNKLSFYTEKITVQLFKSSDCIEYLIRIYRNIELN